MSGPEQRSVFKRWPDPEQRREGTHAFISYAHDDRVRVEPFIELMRECDYRIWFDENLTAGSDWSTALEANVASAWLVIVFLSKRSVRCEWVAKEMAVADQAGRRVMPVLLDALPAAHPLAWLDRHQYLSREPVSAGGLSDVEKGKLAEALRETHASHLTR